MGKTIQTMKELPASERPYEKCVMYGPQCCRMRNYWQSLFEPAVVDCGLRNWHRKCCSIFRVKGTGGLFQMSQEQLQELEGIGRVKAIQLRCLTEITKRMIEIVRRRRNPAL